VVHWLRNTSVQQAEAIGAAMRMRALRDHSYSLRAQEFDKIVSRSVPAHGTANNVTRVGLPATESIVQ
jgi:hypothetical protein